MENKKKVIIDSSSAILLFKSGIFDRVKDCYSLVMSDSVYMELTHEGYTGAREFEMYRNEYSFNVKDVCLSENSFKDEASESLLKLDKGELDSILLYQSGAGEFIIIDDGKGAQFCKGKGIPYINALLAARILYEGTIIGPELFRKSFDALTESGRYSPKILAYARECSKDRLDRFLP